MKHKSRSSRIHKYAKVIFSSLFVLLSTSAFSQEKNLKIRDELVTQSDISVLPPVCKLIVIDKPGIHHGAGNGPLAADAHIFEEPQYQIAKGNPHLHHYCWALVSKQRYFRARGKVKSDYYFRAFMGDIDYVLKNSDKSWLYFDVMLVEQGQMLMVRNDYAAGIQKANEALRYNPNSENAYVLKFDAYKNMGNEKEAVQAAKDGIDKNPDSDRLRKRLARMGVTAPPRPLPESVKSEVSTAPTIIDNIKKPEMEKPPSPTMPQVSNKTMLDEATPGLTPPKKNPYCRFCP